MRINDEEDVDATYGEPTKYIPGSDKKIKALAARYKMKQHLFHPKDQKMDNKMEMLVRYEVERLTKFYTDENDELVTSSREIMKEAINNVSEKL